MRLASFPSVATVPPNVTAVVVRPLVGVVFVYEAVIVLAVVPTAV